MRSTLRGELELLLKTAFLLVGVSLQKGKGSACSASEVCAGLLWEGTCCCPNLWRLVGLERAGLQKHVGHAVSDLSGERAALVPTCVHVSGLG